MSDYGDGDRASFEPHHGRDPRAGTSFQSQAASSRQTVRELAHRTSQRYGSAVTPTSIVQSDGYAIATRALSAQQNIPTAVTIRRPVTGGVTTERATRLSAPREPLARHRASLGFGQAVDVSVDDHRRVADGLLAGRRANSRTFRSTILPCGCTAIGSTARDRRRDIDHAVRHASVVDEVAEDPLRYLLIGPDRSGNLLEVIVLDRPQGPAAIHVMALRAKYRRLLPPGG